ncbi:hypothetical protein CVT26_007741 [Gymnopilus dilepis]|uniref:Uncharacterized protein n=1 Tax=Gymnopilus dilepis TaxID=231916 RepID=A0A409WLJ7_9AGAR|nr:hypothetical protein CVT26_007741 [Gymnopilus dilepis]
MTAARTRMNLSRSKTERRGAARDEEERRGEERRGEERMVGCVRGQWEPVRNVGAEPGTVWFRGVDQARRVASSPSLLLHSLYVPCTVLRRTCSVFKPDLHASCTLDISAIPLVPALEPHTPSLPYVNLKIQTWWDIEEGACRSRPGRFT